MNVNKPIQLQVHLLLQLSAYSPFTAITAANLSQMSIITAVPAMMATLTSAKTVLIRVFFAVVRITG
jgi:hypothetical protein